MLAAVSPLSRYRSDYRCGYRGGCDGRDHSPAPDYTAGAGLGRCDLQSDRNVGQPDDLPADSLTGHKVERRPRAGEERLAATERHGVKIEAIFVDQTHVGQALRQLRSGSRNLSCQFGLQPAYHDFNAARRST